MKTKTEANNLNLKKVKEVLKSNPELDLKAPVAGKEELAALFDLPPGSDPVKELSSVETFLAQTGLNRDQLNQLVLMDSTINVGNEPPIDIPKQEKSGLPGNTITNLNPQRLDLINRFIRLANITGLSFADLALVLQIIYEIPPDTQ